MSAPILAPCSESSVPWTLWLCLGFWAKFRIWQVQPCNMKPSSTCILECGTPSWACTLCCWVLKTNFVATILHNVEPLQNATACAIVFYHSLLRSQHFMPISDEYEGTHSTLTMPHRLIQSLALKMADRKLNKLGLSWAKLRPSFQLSTRFESIVWNQLWIVLIETKLLLAAV